MPHLSLGLPLITMSAEPSIFAYSPSKPNKTTQRKLLLDIPQPHNTTSSVYSRFASPNRFQLLSNHNSSHPAPVEPARARPNPTQALSSISAPPIIADTGCTGLLLQFSNFPALSPFFKHKPLPLVPFTLPDRSVLLVGGGPHTSRANCLFPIKLSLFLRISYPTLPYLILSWVSPLSFVPTVLLSSPPPPSPSLTPRLL